MTLGMLPRKRLVLIDRLKKWLAKDRFNLREISELLGVLESHVRFTPWARPWLFAIQNAMRSLLHRLWGFQHRRPDTNREAALRLNLPATVWNRIRSIIARERASFIWRYNLTAVLDPPMRCALANLLHYASSTDRPWEAKFGTLIPRDPQVEAFGDASLIGGGGFCPELQFWFDIHWSSRVRAAMRLSPSSPNFIHINMLEFVVVILLVAAILVAFQTITPDERALWFPNGLPAIPVVREHCDNTSAVSWANKVTTSSPQGQKLLGIYSELLRSYDICLRSDHIKGEKNVLADFLSRPTNCSLSHADRAAQLYHSQPSMTSWRIFLPSPELLQLLTSALFSQLPVAPPSLPLVLGQLVHGASTSSSSPSL